MTEMKYYKEVLTTNLCDYNNANILVRSDISIIRHNLATDVEFKNQESLSNFIKKVDGTTKDNGEDLQLVMSIYNLLRYSSNYSDVTVLWFFSKDEANNLLSISISQQETPKLMETMEF